MILKVPFHELFLTETSRNYSKIFRCSILLTMCPLDDTFFLCSFEGNPKICALDPCKSSVGKKEIKIIVPVATAVAIFLAVSVLIVVFKKRRPSSIRGSVGYMYNIRKHE